MFLVQTFSLTFQQFILVNAQSLSIHYQPLTPFLPKMESGRKRDLCAFGALGKEVLDLWVEGDLGALWVVLNGFQVTCTGGPEVQLLKVGFVFFLFLSHRHAACPLSCLWWGCPLLCSVWLCHFTSWPWSSAGALWLTPDLLARMAEISRSISHRG